VRDCLIASLSTRVVDSITIDIGPNQFSSVRSSKQRVGLECGWISRNGSGLYNHVGVAPVSSRSSWWLSRLRKIEPGVREWLELPAHQAITKVLPDLWVIKFCSSELGVEVKVD